MNKIIGVCLGAWSVSFAFISIENNNITLDKTYKIIHNGSPQAILSQYLQDNNLLVYPIVVTGRKFRNSVNITNISEAVATEYALEFLLNQWQDSENLNKLQIQSISAIASLGAETFLVYNIDSTNHISSVNAKNKCASGTGEFFLQQIKRMDLNIDESVGLAKDKIPYKVSGRCSVFCKSDCTHALNIGIEKSKVVAGLSKMIADKIEELLRKRDDGIIILVGGVTRNTIVMDFIKRIYPHTFIPDEAEYFEAIGAAIYGSKNISNIKKNISIINIFKEQQSSFTFQQPINNFIDKVTFKHNNKRPPKFDEECILGLDVGSTTTKAVLISNEDSAILSSVYLYTNGNPIKASKDCYRSINDELLQSNTKVKIIGLGTTGSGRQIAGLHAQTEGIFNEITAHSTAAIYFDEDVDTIFEIGGQDAKYSYIVNKVPADYAMNEACSAGTGSFIEEAAFESLGLKVTELEKLALESKNPPNFSDQCAAFISSDIKTAQQEGISRNDILAGLTYSICYNYLNRVKGNRPIGKKIFMQGGVCYNKAIPIAMAAISGTEIIVPPDPGLMGAFGVALQVLEKQKLGLLEKGDFYLTELMNRDVQYHAGFICAGGKDKCDIKCNISLLEINGKKYPFGGGCDMYNNVKKSAISNTTNQQLINYVDIRNKLMFQYSQK
jgi:predicted CoA-substrate-specific enzyme activase